VPSPLYPDAVCGVVWPPRQFSWTQDEQSDRMTDSEAIEKTVDSALAVSRGTRKDSAGALCILMRITRWSSAGHMEGIGAFWESRRSCNGREERAWLECDGLPEPQTEHHRRRTVGRHSHSGGQMPTRRGSPCAWSRGASVGVGKPCASSMVEVKASRSTRRSGHGR
jgi:Cell Wall Hydrolase